MTANLFSPERAREFVGDELARKIEARARLDADAGVFELLEGFDGSTYSDQLTKCMREIVYKAQHAKRSARNNRKNITTLLGPKSDDWAKEIGYTRLQDDIGNL